MRTVRFYRTEGGRCPVEEFLDSLPSKAAQKVAWVLKLVRELDAIPSRYFKKLADTDGLWECRVEHGGNISRLLAFFDQGDIVVLTHGFAKKTQKTPRDQIHRATQLRVDYLRRRQ